MAFSKEVKDCWEGKRQLRPLHTHLNAPEDAVGVYPVLGTTEDGGGVVITIVPRAVAANAKKGEQDSGWFTGTLWKRTSAAEGMFFKSSRDDSVGFCLPPLGLLEAGLCERRGCSILGSPSRSPSRSDSREHTTYASLRQDGQSHSAGFHPQQVVYHQNGADSCEYLRNEQMPQVSH